MDSIKKLGPVYFKEKLNGMYEFDTAFKMTKEDRMRMEELYFQMSNKQQKLQQVGFFPKNELLIKLVPTKEQIESWKNPKMYGIWFAGSKRMKNSVLNNYSNTDFYHYELRVLDDKLSRIMKYKIEVGLLTKEAFEKQQARIMLQWKARPDDKYEMTLQSHIIEKIFTVK